MKKSLLFIVTERNSANGICVKALIDAFVHNDYGVSCIVNREYKDPKNFNIHGADYYTVRPRFVYALESMLASKQLSQFKKTGISLFRLVLNKIELLLSLPTWPVISRSYSNRICSLIEYINNKKHIDIVVPVYSQIDTIIAANRFKMKGNKDVVIVPYFLDSLGSGYGPKMMTKEWIEKRGLNWEKRLLNDVNHIIMMKSSRPFYEGRKNDLTYFSKILFLDLPLFVPKTSRGKDIHSDGIKEILYVGTIPGHIRNPKFFLEVFKRIELDDIRLTIIGPSTCESIISPYVEADKRINRIQRVSHEEALEQIDKADFLLNLGNNLKTMTPSKIFEYISTGKPIISTAPIPNEPSIPYLQMYKNCLIVEEYLGEVESSAKQLAFFLTSATKVDPESLTDVFVLNSPLTFVRAIEQL